MDLSGPNSAQRWFHLYLLIFFFYK
jgi:hypothetical protein